MAKKLPISSLEHTHKLLLKSSAPLLSPPRLQSLAELAQAFFASDEAKTLQQALLRKADSSHTSWLKAWWEEQAYLLGRSPIAVHSNYILLFGLQDVACDQIVRAARLSCAAREFSDMIERNKLEPDTLQGKPMCMRMFQHVFRTCRIPGKDCDSIRTFTGTSHMVVTRRERFYLVDLYSKSGAPVPVSQIERQLVAIREDADHSVSKAHAISALTATNRDLWAKVRDDLQSLDTNNRKNLELIESSMFVLCLDDRSPSTPTDVARITLHGDARGLYFDKSVQFVVFENGLGGVNAEHSPSDAPIIARMLDYCLIRASEMKHSPGAANKYTKISEKCPVRQLDFKLNGPLINAVKEAVLFAEKEVKDISVSILRFNEYGTDQIKEWKASPDAFAQMMMQLAYYRRHNEFPATYETASVRQFDWGRTETIRSCSEASAAWAKAMDSTHMQMHEKRTLFLKALEAHKEYTTLANNAQGVDRHLLGLRLIAQELGRPIPSFLQHELVKQSSYYRLSTSNTTRPRCSGGGFGPVVPDGYGACYGLHAKLLQFMVTSFNSCAKTDAFDLSDRIAQASRDVRALMSLERARL